MSQDREGRQPLHWSRAKLIAFRFAFAITAISIFKVAPFVSYFLPLDTLKGPLNAVLNRTEDLEWSATMSIGAFAIRTATGGRSPIHDLVSRYGRDGAMSALSYLVALFVLASLTTIVWTAVDRRRASYFALNRFMRVYVRYALGVVMLTYALLKVIPTQFGFLTPGELLRPFGQLSPFEVLWDFMAVSPGYTVFTGVVELLGATLLFFPRTTLLGGLVLCGTLTNVVAMNVAYDVPAVTYATLLLMLDAIILAPYVEPLLDILLLQRTSELPLEPVALRQRWYHSPVAKGGLLCVLVLPLLYQDVVYRRSFSGAGHPVYGLFDVTTFARNGQSIIPLSSDSATWKRVATDARGDSAGLSVQFANGDLRQFDLRDDTVHRVWTIRQWDSAEVATLRYVVLSNGDVSLDGRIGSDSVHLVLHPVDARKFFKLLGK